MLKEKFDLIKRNTEEKIIMPKMKTRKGIKKRFKLTAKGKIKRRKNYSNHLFTSKSSKRKRRLKKPDLVHSTDERRIKRALPYG